MKSPMSAWRVVFLFLIGVAFMHAPLHGAEKTYDARLAEARRFADEKSWALARDAYTEAADLAPDDEARRWCELWQLQATWRCFSREDWNWPNGSRNVAKLKTMFDRLLVPYEKEGRGRDAYWVAVMEERIEFHRAGAFDHPAQIRDLLEIADYYGGKTTVPENVDVYIRCLERLADMAPGHAHLPDEYREKFIARLGQAARLTALSPDDRAWSALQYAHYATNNKDISDKERNNRREAALVASRGTRWEAVACAREFVLRTLSGQWPVKVNAMESDTPANLEELMSQALALQGGLADAPDRRFTRDTREALKTFINWWKRPILLLDAPDYIAPGEPLRIDYATANCGEITMELLQFPMDAYRPVDWWGLRRAGISLSDHHEENWRAGGTVVKRLVLRGSPAGSMQWVRQSVEISDALPPGFYTMALAGSGRRPEERVANIFVTNVRAAAIFHTEGPRQLFIFHHDSGMPVSGETVTGILDGKTWTGKTDDRGYLTLPVSNEKKTKDKYIMWRGETVIALAGHQPIWFGEDQFEVNGMESYEDALNPNVWADVFFDRALYRPGETVRWKIVARERNDGRFEPCRANLALTVEYGEETLIDKLPLTLNKNGTAHGDFPLPVALKPGMARMSLSLVDDASRNKVHLPHAFSVDNYVPSGIEASVEWMNPEAVTQLGTDLVFCVRAQYYSGGPVTGARVHVALNAGAEEPADEDEDSATKRFIKDWIKEYASKPVELVTDSNGEARFHMPRPGVRGLRRVVVDASVVLEGAASVKAWTIAILSHAAPATVGSIAVNRGLVKPGESMVFTVGVNNAAGAPCAFSGKARIMDAKWSPRWRAPDGSFVREDALEAAKRRFILMGDKRKFIPMAALGLSDYELTEAAVFDVTCGSDGKITVPFTPSREGLYTVRLEADGRTLDAGYSAEPQLIVADEKTTELALPPRMRKVFGFDAWREGAPLRLLVVQPAGAARAMFIVCTENEIMTRVIESAGKQVSHITLDRTPAVLGGVQYVLFSDSKRSKIGSGYVKIGAPENTRLSVNIEPAPENSRPGEKAEARIVVRDSSGRPAAAEVAVAISDQAVDDLAGGGTGFDIMNSSKMWRVAPAKIAYTMSRRTLTGPLPLRDARPGALLNPSGRTMTFDDLLSEIGLEEVFGLDDEGRAGYAANMMSDNGSARIRRHFSSTAFWAPEILTDAQGQADITFSYPDNLTRWNIRALAVGADGNRFGVGQAFTQTTLPFQARLQTPRFLIQGDRALVSARLINRTDAAVDTEAFVTPEGSVIFPLGANIIPAYMTVPAQAERIAAWPVLAMKPGEATLSLAGKTKTESDAMALTIPVHEDGIRQQIAASARLAADATECAFPLSLPVSLPAQINRRRLDATLQLSPNQAGAMLDALPYLIDFPYGCVEQTMSRFMPAVVVQKTFADMGLSGDMLEKRIMAGQNVRMDFDKMIKQGLDRLVRAERKDGGFGWWPDSRVTDLWMTAYVAWGLDLAQKAGIAVSQGLRERTAEAIFELISEDEKISDNTNAWVLGVIAQADLRQGDAGKEEDTRKKLQDLYKRIYNRREKLSTASRASLLLASARFATTEQRAVLLRNLENGAQRVRTEGMGDTVHWGTLSGYWRAVDGAVESTALTLLGLLQVDAFHPHVEPAVNWLLLNRRGAAWENTRATAFALVALSQYLKQRAAAFTDAHVEVSLNGKPLRTVMLNLETLLAGGAFTVPLDSSLLRADDNIITIRRISGSSPVYATAFASAWARGDSVKPNGHLLAVSRDFVSQKIERTVTGAMRITPVVMDGDRTVARAGEQVVARVKLEIPNDLEYIMVTVPKPAGCEPVNALSGWDARLVRVDGKYGSAAGEDAENDNDNDDDNDDDYDINNGRDRDQRIYREEHDDHSAFFLDHVEAGAWEVRMTMRAVTAGDFRALPVKVEAMYVPEVRANSDARRVRIE
ncbi:MAG: hypothetical protein LBM04_09685 [Opitutaceae bacterium]|jgi:uncharacterized protein YfaS (alpha-2-macroglobulin family)|nr:hypothetical protein [Opitutaceae bacterium]